LNQETEVLEAELSKANETIEWQRRKLEEKGSCRARNYRAPGNQRTLQLELKCFNQQVELYEYCLSAERNKVKSMQVHLRAAHIDEALLHSTVDGTIRSVVDTPIEPSTSKSSLLKLSEDAAEVGTTSTVDVSISGVIFTQSTSNTSSVRQSVVTLQVLYIPLKSHHYPSLVEAMTVKHLRNGMNNLK